MSRTAQIERTTAESSIKVAINLDGTGVSQISTTIGFYDHMLTALSRHSLVDMTIEASGDTAVDAHHVIEDTAIVLGQAFGSALGDQRGIARFGEATIPLDEA
ncbi:MAG: imidazoleglycerol-phosphate dehydratase, partial [Propionibacteriaceae bacterium]|nr:imidazoleglycerol-phosphate dehydratase [Propionibacteriaceae bacterium]